MSIKKKGPIDKISMFSSSFFVVRLYLFDLKSPVKILNKIDREKLLVSSMVNPYLFIVF